MLVQLGAQGLAQVGHLVEVGDVAVVDPLHHLVGAIALLAQPVFEEILEPGAVQVEDVGAAVGRTTGRNRPRARGRGPGAFGVQQRDLDGVVAGSGHAGPQRAYTSVAGKK